MTIPPTPARMIACIALASILGCHRRAGLAGNQAADGPTWSHDIAPLLERRCGACHGDGRSPAVAPPALGGYREARQAAATSLRAIRRRMMPPFGADDTELCGTWTDAAWLTDDEIATFGAWVEHGTPHGFGPPVRATPEAAPGANRLAALGPGVAFAPGLGERAYRCFLIDAPVTSATALLTGLAVTSEPRAAVRQANLYALTSPAAIARARARDAADDGPGWACPGAPPGADLVASWSRNTPVQRSPDGTGVPLRAPAYVAQVRYDLIASGPGVPVTARFLLSTASAEPAHAARLVALGAAPFTLPPDQPQTRVGATWTVDRATTFRGLVPRMNSLGRTLDLQVTSAAERRCLAHFGHWDPYDQQLFHAAAPVPLSRGDTVTLTCTFATTSRNADTKMGEAPPEGSPKMARRGPAVVITS